MAEAPALALGGGPGADDHLTPFQVDPLDARGRLARLGPQLDRLLKRHAYPTAVSRAVAEAVVLTALLGSALKLEGRFQLQTKTDGAIPMLVVDFDAPNKLRAYAQFDADGVPDTASTASLIGHGHLALTIDQGGHMNRYQGVTALDGQGLEAAAHQYFRQSEQIPTRIRIAVGEVETPEGASWRAGGLFIQFLPEAPERMRQGDLDPGDAPEDARHDEFTEDDAWLEAKALVETVEDHELLDPTLSAERLLYRLFHERGVRLFAGQDLVESCRCSQERILTMLRRFTPGQRAEMKGDDGQIGVTCEFCSTRYHIAPADAEPVDVSP
ncbi:MAG: Hsp33 family molecular chaperone [Beijerinckiaceae bacterium]